MKKELVFTIQFVVSPIDLEGSNFSDAIESLQAVGSAEITDVIVRDKKVSK